LLFKGCFEHFVGNFGTLYWGSGLVSSRFFAARLFVPWITFLTFCFLTTAEDNKTACVCSSRLPCVERIALTQTHRGRLLFNLWSRARKNCALWRFHKGNG